MAKGDRSSTASTDTSILGRLPEVVGVLPNEDELEAAIDELSLCGFDREQISVLARQGNRGEPNDLAARASVADLEDDPRTHLGAFMSSHSRAELEAAAVGMPLYVLGVGGYAAIVAAGGSLAVALVALLLGAATGAGLGGILTRTIARHHRHAVAAQIAKGGLLVWVQVKGLDQENKAIQVLNAHKGRHVHLHDIERPWGIDDVPFSDAQPDPFLESEPSRE